MNGHPRRHFKDRSDAGRQLAQALADYREHRPWVLAISRGGLVVGRAIADALDGDLDALLVRNRGLSGKPVPVIGALDLLGRVRLPGAPAVPANEAGARVPERRRWPRRALRRRRGAGVGRVIVVVDDALTTGERMRAALSVARDLHPALLVGAVPVADTDGLNRLAGEVDELVCLQAAGDGRPVEAWYPSDEPVDDRRVMELLSTPGTPAREGDRPPTLRFELDGVALSGEWARPDEARGLVVLAHSCNDGRLRSRDRRLARVLQHARLATLQLDLLGPDEQHSRWAWSDSDTLAARLRAVVAQLRDDPELARLPLGLLGTGVSAAAVLAVAAQCPADVAAVVSRSGRTDLAGDLALSRVSAPTLFIVGAEDRQLIALNQAAQARLPGRSKLMTVPHARQLYQEPGALLTVAELACAWFERWLVDARERDARDRDPHRTGRRGPGQPARRVHAGQAARR